MNHTLKRRMANQIPNFFFFPHYSSMWFIVLSLLLWAWTWWQFRRAITLVDPDHAKYPHYGFHLAANIVGCVHGCSLFLYATAVLVDMMNHPYFGNKFSGGDLMMLTCSFGYYLNDIVYMVQRKDWILVIHHILTECLYISFMILGQGRLLFFILVCLAEVTSPLINLWEAMRVVHITQTSVLKTCLDGVFLVARCVLTPLVLWVQRHDVVKLFHAFYALHWSHVWIVSVGMGCIWGMSFYWGFKILVRWAAAMCTLPHRRKTTKTSSRRPAV